MKRWLIALSATVLLASPAAVVAQTKKDPDRQPGQSWAAPGQKATSPGEAKTYAPGQQDRVKGREGKGAKEYAPGQQRKQQ
jgi:hypothetical protein